MEYGILRVRSQDFQNLGLSNSRLEKGSKRIMPENKVKELMRKHDLRLEDMKEGKHRLHHLRSIVRSEELPFEVFQALVKMRR